MTERELAYAAGVFDGEGSVGIYVGGKTSLGRPRYNLRLSVGNTDTRLTNWLAETFGGKVRAKQPRVPSRHRQAYDWYLFGNNAVEFLRLIRPFLLLKAEQADVAIKFQATITPSGGPGGSLLLTDEQIAERETYRQQLSALKGRLGGSE